MGDSEMWRVMYRQRPPVNENDDPLDMAMLFGRTLRWWEQHGLFRYALRVLRREERLEGLQGEEEK